ncbi:hypothetical protein WB44_01345 [Synechococcus sp. WH 8020]|uniref:hypothetical protein n=1 Tax=Synechococcus sp. (strain WH8020) TaxID=32052 RepID=UPI00065264A5|nr:hypothetical protein [Synechococcus sp. WH 8020]AKN59993.1 hypothetical protein WB44_01345 [Synechococcus sp. WH 8020]
MNEKRLTRLEIDQSETELQLLIQSDDVSAEVLAFLAEDPDISDDLLLEIAKHPRLDPNAETQILLNRMRLNRFGNDEICTALQMKRLPDEWKGIDTATCRKRLITENVDEKILNILSKSWEWDIREAVALSEATPDYILEDLRLTDEDYFIDKVLTQRQLEDRGLLLDTDEVINKIRDENIGADSLAILSGSNYSKVRRAVANNPNTPVEVLQVLSRDEDDDVKNAVEFRKRGLDRKLRIMEKLELARMMQTDDYEPNPACQIDTDSLSIISKVSSCYLGHRAKDVLELRGMDIDKIEDEDIARQYLLDYSTGQGCCVVEAIINLADSSKYRTFVKSLRIEGDDDIFFLEQDINLSGDSERYQFAYMLFRPGGNSEWKKESDKVFRLYTKVFIDFSDATEDSKVQKFIELSLEEGKAVTVEICVYDLVNQVEVDLVNIEDIEAYIEE